MVFDLPPESEHPQLAYPFIDAVEMHDASVNTDITTPYIYVRRYKLNEDATVSKERPMLIDASVIDTILAEKQMLDAQQDRLTRHEFT